MNDCTNLCNDLGQTRVAHHQPTARSDAIGFILELLWVHLIEVFKSILKKKE